MDKRITFNTKAQSNKEQEDRFLAMSPSERFEWFLRCMGSRFGPYEDRDDDGNFVVTKKGDAVR